MANTRVHLKDWTYGQFKSETLSAQILELEEYLKIVPSSPAGGPDSKAGGDIAFNSKDGSVGIAACYFPPTSEEKKFNDVKAKYKADLDKAAKKSASLFILLQIFMLRRMKS